jgi:FlaA1/EpsC-like NDP-sugar epimerase
LDILLLTGSLYVAHLVRFDFNIPQQHLHLLYWVIPFVLVTKVVSFFYFDLYRGMWRFTSIADLFNIIKASSISTLLIICFILFSPRRFIGFPRSVFVIDWCLTILFIAGFRLAIRVYFVHIRENESWPEVARSFWGLLTRKQTAKKNLLIVGAGNCGEKLYREIRDNATLQYNVVGFTDDDPAKIGMKIHGLPVLSPIKEIAKSAKKVNATEILIAVPSANAQQMRGIVDYCKSCGITFKTIPGMTELIDGKVTVNAIREVAYSDLLGREIIKLDEVKIGAYLKGKSVLVTGPGGSIGSELCRQICRFKPMRISLYDRAESSLYEIDPDIKRNSRDVEILPLLVDTRDRNQIDKAFQASKPQVVFHAAAYKHVPILEMQPWKAVKNNIRGRGI